MTNDVFVRLAKLPWFCKGFTLRDSDGNYNIFINDSMTREWQQDTYNHELAHINNGDFDSMEPVINLEEAFQRRVPKIIPRVPANAKAHYRAKGYPI